MNYTISYPINPSGQAQMTSQASLLINSVPMNSVPMNSQGQRAIVLTRPTQSAAQVNTGNHAQQSFPMVMQMGSSSVPVFYTYQNEGIVNASIQNKIKR